MGWFETSVPQRLLSLLEEERQLLLVGELNGLSNLVEKKTSLLKRLDEKQHKADVIERIKRQARRNEILLHAAIDGVKLATQRLIDAQKKPDFKTYDSSGAPISLAKKSGSSFAKRA